MSEQKKTIYQPPHSAEELIRRYQSGERYFGETALDEDPVDFSNLVLAGIVFAPHTFLFADFRNANLKNADFSNCNLKTCDFRGSDLENASFRNALLEATEFNGANLANTDFTGASCYSRVLKSGEKPDW